MTRDADNLLRLDGLSLRHGAHQVLDQVSFTIGRGECVGLIGPNGAGKTTLMRAALGLERHLGHSSLAALAPAARARAAAFLPQARQIVWPVSVESLVALGRVPYLPRGARLQASDHAAIEAAIDRLALGPYRTRDATALSGGEQARVLIARALAQQAPLLIADEPIAGLDPAHQIAAMQLFAALARENHAVLLSLHDLGLAARYCTRLIMLHQGRVVADGPPDAVLTPALMAQVFGVSVWRMDTEQGPLLVPMDVLRDAG
ncbi:MAG: ABC transporter ATP-binding protein [Paracoccaceae bacterium]